MMLTEKDITLQHALQDFGLRELPDEWMPSSGIKMIDGIALVKKAGGVKSFVKVVNNGESIVIKQDYGQVLPIMAIEHIYAVNVLEKRFTPELRSDREILSFLVKNGYLEKDIKKLLSNKEKTIEQIQADRAILDGYIDKTAVSIAEETLQEEERCKEISNYSKRFNNGKKKQASKN